MIVTEWKQHSTSPKEFCYVTDGVLKVEAFVSDYDKMLYKSRINEVKELRIECAKQELEILQREDK